MKSVSGSPFDWAIDGLRLAMVAVPVLLGFAQPARADADFGDVQELALVLPQAVEAPNFGPFRLAGHDRAELVGAIESDAPAQFRALLTARPELKQIDMIECPGSEDDDANLALARMIRAAGLTMRVPRNGSIRSGGVELFLAGTRRIAEDGAEIGVHSWQDSDGLEATDFPPDDPVHQPYLRFYRDMGMNPERARAFYDFTNEAASFDDYHAMSRAELTRFGLLTD